MGMPAMQRAERYVRAAFERELEAVRGTVSGRNCALNRAVFAIATLMHTGAVSRSEIETRFLEAALALGLSVLDPGHDQECAQRWPAKSSRHAALWLGRSSLQATRKQGGTES